MIEGPVQLVIFIIAVALSIALAPKPMGPEVPTLDDMKLPQCDDGTPQIVVFGTAWIDNWTVLSFGNFGLDQVFSSDAKK